MAIGILARLLFSSAGGVTFLALGEWVIFRIPHPINCKYIILSATCESQSGCYYEISSWPQIFIAFYYLSAEFGWIHISSCFTIVVKDQFLYLALAMNDNHKIDMLKTNIAAGTNDIRCWNCWNVIYIFSATSSSCLLFEFNFVNRNLIPFIWKDDKYQLPLAMISTSNKRKKKNLQIKRNQKIRFIRAVLLAFYCSHGFFGLSLYFMMATFFERCQEKCVLSVSESS